jgi:hypothetical protein
VQWTYLNLNLSGRSAYHARVKTAALHCWAVVEMRAAGWRRPVRYGAPSGDPCWLHQLVTLRFDGRTVQRQCTSRIILASRASCPSAVQVPYCRRCAVATVRRATAYCMPYHVRPYSVTINLH